MTEGTFEAILAVLLLVALVFVLAVMFGTEKGREEMRKAGRDAAERKAAKRSDPGMTKVGGTMKAPISQVADRSSGGLACPKCGGTNLKAKRSGKAVVGVTAGTVATFGLGAVFAGKAKKRWVVCETCGTRYQRG